MTHFVSFKHSLLRWDAGKFFRILFLITLAGICEGGFVLSLRKILSYGDNTSLPDQAPSSWMWLWVCAPLAIVGIRTLLQWKAQSAIVRYIRGWISEVREKLLEDLQATEFPIARKQNLSALETALREKRLQLREGALGFFQSASSVLQMLVFVPLLTLFPASYSLLTGLLLAPVIFLSRFRIQRLREKSGKWAQSDQADENRVRYFTERVDMFLGNQELSQEARHISEEGRGADESRSQWEAAELLFPAIMELTYFVMLCLGFLGLWAAGSVSSETGWNWFPFAVLLLLMYKPIREWSRFFPKIQLAESSWREIENLRESWKKFSPKNGPRFHSGEKVEIRNLSFGYQPGRDVWKNISLEINPAQTTLLWGPNGSGKTTLLKLLCGIEFSRQGGIFYPQSLNAKSYPDIAYLPQWVRLPRNFGDFFTQLKLLHPENWQGLNNILALEEILAKMPSEKSSAYFPGEALSGGERQRLGLGLIFSREAQWLLLDEPTTWLPGDQRMDVMRALFDFWHQAPGTQGPRGILLASHEVELQNLCDHIYSLDTALFTGAE